MASFDLIRNKNHVNKNQGWEPIHEKYNTNKNKNTHNPKKKTKANNQQKLGKNLCKKNSW
jgi:hypothetical protein